MVEYDKKVFWRYIWYDQLKPSNWIRSSTFYEYIMMFTVLYAVLFSTITLRQKAILFMGFLVGISILKFYALFKSGQHRAWNRKVHGIPSRSDVKRLKIQNKIQKKEKEGRNNLPLDRNKVSGI